SSGVILDGVGAVGAVDQALGGRRQPRAASARTGRDRPRPVGLAAGGGADTRIEEGARLAPAGVAGGAGGGERVGAGAELTQARSVRPLAVVADGEMVHVPVHVLVAARDPFRGAGFASGGVGGAGVRQARAGGRRGILAGDAG